MMPTIRTKKDKIEIDMESLVVKPFKRPLLKIGCHMLVLNGKRQDRGGDSDRTTWGIKLSIFCKQGEVLLRSCELGTKKQKQWDRSEGIAFSRWGQDVVSIGSFEENPNVQDPGPLLGLAHSINFDDCKLEIQLVPCADPPLRTFLLAFTARKGVRLNAPSNCRPLGIEYVLACGEMYRICQRATDDWLARRSGEQWYVEFDAGGLDRLWNEAREQYRNALTTGRPSIASH